MGEGVERGVTYGESATNEGWYWDRQKGIGMQKESWAGKRI